MKKTTLSGVMAMLCLWVSAQQNIKPLTVGDTVPDITFNNLINYPTQTAKLSDFKGKLVILDFWATWCGSCVQAIPSEDSLQRKFKKKIQFIMINAKRSGDSVNAVINLLNRIEIKQKRKLTIPVSIHDTTVFALFNYRALPHYVWIDENRAIYAITGIKEVTESHIAAFVGGRREALPLKDDERRRKEKIEGLKNY